MYQIDPFDDPDFNRMFIQLENQKMLTKMAKYENRRHLIKELKAGNPEIIEYLKHEKKYEAFMKLAETSD